MDRPLRIVTVNSPPIARSRKQAHIREVLDKVLGPFGKGDIVFKRMKYVAARKVSEGSLEYGWGMLLDGKLEEWSESFTGKYHCEAVLGSLLHREMIQIPELNEDGASEFNVLLDTVCVCP
jgi:hypothetical protein